MLPRSARARVLNAAALKTRTGEERESERERGREITYLSGVEKMSTSSAAQKRRKSASSSSSFLGFKCGCRDAKAVSVTATGVSPDSGSAATPVERRPLELTSSADTTLITLTSVSTSSYWEEDETDAKMESSDSESTPSFSELLRQLGELEQSVMAWGSCRASPAPRAAGKDKEDEEEEGKDKKKVKGLHRRSKSEGGGGWRRAAESVAVVKESADPLDDFRRSMLQMIVEKQIVDDVELRELLRRFLALNSPLHHDLIIRAFAEIWAEVFSGHRNTSDLLLRRRRRNHPIFPSFRRL